MSGAQRSVPTRLEESQSQSKKRKRNRETLSCTPCHDRKVACDRKRPCTSCVRHRDPAECRYLAEPVRVSPELDSIPPVATGTSTSRSSSNHEPKRIDSTERIDTQSLVQASVLSGIADNFFARTGLCIKGSTAIYYVGPMAYIILTSMEVFSLAGVQQSLKPQWIRINSICSKMSTRRNDSILDLNPEPKESDAFLNFLPPDECRCLVRRFLDGLNRIYPVVDPITFETELSDFLQNPSKSSPAWKALLSAILAVGYCTPIHASPNGSYYADPEKARRLANFAQTEAFSASAQWHRVHIIALQTMLIVVLYKKLSPTWIDGNDSPSGLLGLANRIVFTLGLHRDSEKFGTVVEPAMARLRRRIFTIYLILDFQHCLQNGMPFLMRVADFDKGATVHVSDASDDADNQLLAAFARVYPVLIPLYQTTHSHSSGTATSGIADLLKTSLSLAQDEEERIKSCENPDLITSIQASMITILTNRVHVGMFLGLLPSSAAELRSQLTSNMLQPALSVLDSLIQVFNAIKTNVATDALKGWQIILLSQISTCAYNAVAYLLVFLEEALVNETLLSFKGDDHMAADSSRIFRKVRITMNALSGFPALSSQAVKGQCAYTAYLRAVEERYQVYVETGLVHLDIASDECARIIKAAGSAMDVLLDKLEAEMKLTYGTPESLGPGLETPRLAAGDQILGLQDFSLLNDWDWDLTLGPDLGASLLYGLN